jgi:hypothetical protein
MSRSRCLKRFDETLYVRRLFLEVVHRFREVVRRVRIVGEQALLFRINDLRFHHIAPFAVT